MNRSTSFSLVFCFFAALLGSSCARSTHTGSPEPEPLVETPVPETRIVYLEPDSRDTWPELFLNSSDVSANDIALKTGELVITAEELKAADAGDLETRESQGNGADYYPSLEQELLLLAFLRDRLAEDSDYLKPAARARLRSEASALVLEYETRHDLSVSKEETRARYETDLALYTQPSRVSIRLILVPTQAEADAVTRRLEAGEPFAAVATDVSIHSSRESDGEIEPFARGTYSEDLEDAAFALSPGERKAVMTGRGVFIMEKIAENRGGVTSFEEVEKSIRAVLLKEKQNKRHREFLESLEKRYRD